MKYKCDMPGCSYETEKEIYLKMHRKMKHGISDREANVDDEWRPPVEMACLKYFVCAQCRIVRSSDVPLSFCNECGGKLLEYWFQAVRIR